MSHPYTCQLCGYYTRFGNEARIQLHTTVSHSGGTPITEHTGGMIGMNTHGIGFYEHAYNYAYRLPTSAWEIGPSEYADWYVRTYGEGACSPDGCKVYECAHEDHTIAYPRAVAELAAKAD